MAFVKRRVKFLIVVTLAALLFSGLAFLCGGGGKPTCPPSGGTVTGTITAADILTVSGQGIAAGDFAGAVRAIESGNTYVNVRSTIYPMGEIRGQITN